jgi:hypothetical protein
MEAAIRSIWNCLDSEGRLVMVVGRLSNICKVPFYNGQIINEIITNYGFCDIMNTERVFQNKFGNNIKEDIIIATKSTKKMVAGIAREVACRHLIEAFNTTVKDEIKADIHAAIETIDDICKSPLYQFEREIKYA